MRLTSTGRLAGVMALLVGTVTAPGAGGALSRVAGDDFPAVALAAAHLAALGLSCWTVLVLLAGASRLPVPGVPARLGAALFTTAVIASVASPAQAESARDLDGLTLPDRPTIVRTAAPPTTTVTVAPGDTLWTIAAGHLPHGSSAADVARSCAGWFAANRQVIGADPDLIHPGQVLTPPTPEQDPS